jgi:dTDP-4-dehydrorhamnose reductase
MQVRPIFVVGAAGQAARALARLGTIAGHPVVCRGRSHVDITAAASSLQRSLDALAPVAVVNAAAYTAVDKAEQERAAAFAVNGEGPAHLAQVCHDRGLPLVHISTDYVFDGSSSTPYREIDPVRPLGVYGASKLAGEEAVRQACPQHVIVRTAWLFSRDGQNFAKTMLRLGAESVELSVVDDQRGSPTSADDLAAAIAMIVDRLLGSPEGNRADDLWGTYHVTCAGETTWYGFAEEIFRQAAAAGRKTPRLKPISAAEFNASAPRPHYSVLNNGKVQAAFGIAMPPWQQSYAVCFDGGRLPASGDKVA